MCAKIQFIFKSAKKESDILQIRSRITPIWRLKIKQETQATTSW